MLPTVIALAISTILNAVYFLRLVITLYTIPEAENAAGKGNDKRQRVFVAAKGQGEASAFPASSRKLRLASVSFILLNLVLGLCSQPIVNQIGNGLTMFE